MKPLPALLIDGAATCAFMAIGMASHAHSYADYPARVAPFLLALGAAWLVPKVRQSPISWKAGLIVWPITTVGGLALRKATGGGISGAMPFISAGTLAVLLLGWRIIARAKAGSVGS